jgi:hypothetical protein
MRVANAGVPDRAERRVDMAEFPEGVQMCMRGHVLNEVARWNPGANMKFCPQCGGASTTECSTCRSPITSAGNPYREFVRPAFCAECGKPFPWTETGLTAADELTDELDLTATEKNTLKGDIRDLTSETPRTPLAASRFKKFISKVTPEAGKALLQIVVSVATEEAKKKLIGL